MTFLSHKSPSPAAMAELQHGKADLSVTGFEATSKQPSKEAGIFKQNPFLKHGSKKKIFIT